MRLSRKLTFLAAVLLACSPAFAGKKDDDSKPSKDGQKEAAAKSKGKDKDKDKDKNKDAKGKGDGTDATDDDKPLAIPLVQGQPSLGLKIPRYRPDGKLEMTFIIGEATKLDNDHVKMGNMQVETRDENGDTDLDIDLPVSTLDLNTRVITSHVPFTIKRDDFKLEGSELEFDTKTKKGRLAGHVHMTIYDLKEAAGGPDEQTKQPATNGK